MVDRALIGQLQNVDDSLRREAIVALARSKDREAIPHLNRVAEGDPESDLRELARKAAIYIDKHAPATNVKPFKMPWDDLDEDEGEDAGVSSAAVLSSDYPEPTEEEIATKQDQEWAERYVERAWQAHYVGGKADAEEFLRKAFERWPAISEQQLAREAASKIMGMSADKAVAALLKPKTMRRADKPATVTGKHRPTKAEKTVDEIEDGSFKTMLLDLVIYFVLVFLTTFGVLYAGVQLLADAYEGAPVVADDAGTAAVRSVITQAAAEGTGYIASSAAATAGSSTAAFLVQAFVMHLAAVTFLGGNGTLARQIRKTYLFIALGGWVVVILLVASFFASTLIGDSALLRLMLILVVLGYLMFYAWRLSVAYNFDIGRGCVTMILSGILYVCLGLAFSVILLILQIGPFENVIRSLPR